MKFFLLAFLALVCVVTVSSAPASVDELAFGPIGNIFKQIKERMQQFQCTSSIVIKTLATTGLKKDLNEFIKSNAAVSADFALCAVAGGVIDVLKCELKVVQTLPEYFAVFIEDLSKNHKEVADQIRQQVADRCKFTFGLDFLL